MRSENRQVTLDDRKLLANIIDFQATVRELWAKRKADVSPCEAKIQLAEKELNIQKCPKTPQ
jgi:hypothetical protein